MESVVNRPPDDVIIETLLRLPVKSLLRFRSVCKAWYHLIKSHDFIAGHFNHPASENDHHVVIKRCLQDRATNVLSIHSNTESLSIVSPNFQIPHLNHMCVQVLGPCKGLICITDYKIIVLCNPATREFTVLPERPFACPPDMRCAYRGVGFGFDVSSDDYKVVRIVNLIEEDDYLFHILKSEVYQCSIDSWRQIDYALPDIKYDDCFETIFHEASHWYAMRDYTEIILSFNITTETFQEFDFPDDGIFDEGNRKRKCLTVLNESLALLYYIGPWVRSYEQFIDVWVMKDYGVFESWTKQLIIGPLSELAHPITSWNNSALLLERTNGQLISCALDTQEIKEFDVVGYPTTLRAVINYKDSLVSIKRVSDRSSGN